jgi:hypothetical protein
VNQQYAVATATFQISQLAIRETAGGCETPPAADCNATATARQQRETIQQQQTGKYQQQYRQHQVHGLDDVMPANKSKPDIAMQNGDHRSPLLNVGQARPDADQNISSSRR